MTRVNVSCYHMSCSLRKRILLHIWRIKTQIWCGDSLGCSLTESVDNAEFWRTEHIFPSICYSISCTGWSGLSLFTWCNGLFSHLVPHFLVTYHSYPKYCDVLTPYLVGVIIVFLKTHFSLQTPKRVTGKQCRPRSDAAECCICSGSQLMA